MLTLLCSGQGTQHADMFRLTGNLPAAETIFSNATSLLGTDPRDWVLTASPETMRQNRPAQIVCVTQALSAHRLIEPVLPERFLTVGYSVGQMAAWGIAGLLPEERLLSLVTRRAELMDLASGENDGLVSVRGLALDQVTKLARQKDVEIAIVNPGDAFILGGRTKSLEAFRDAALEAGAMRSSLLSVSVASHTSRLASAVHAFSEAIAAAKPNPPSGDVILLDGLVGSTLFTREQSIETLSRQIAETIHWDACLAAAVERGTSVFLELGPGRALAEMAGATYPELPARGIEDFSSPEGLRKWLSQTISS